MTQELDQRLDPDDLQGELRDLLSLAVVGDHVRWVVTGEGAAELAEWLASATLQWRAWADDLARHLVTLGVAPDARVRSVAKDIPVHWVPEGWLRPDDAARLVGDRLGSLAGWARYRHCVLGLGGTRARSPPDSGCSNDPARRSYGWMRPRRIA
jgi:starvation-inducible DNA-binding protein